MTSTPSFYSPMVAGLVPYVPGEQPAIANLIREGKNYQIPSAMQTGRAYGQKLMNDALMELIQAGKVDPMEAYMKCPDKETFMATLKRNNYNWDPRGEERPMPL